jgi:hypothetical protein
MSAMYEPRSYEHPSLRLQVTPEQRTRAENWLQEAYADGRLSEDEFDRRIEQVLSASTRKELNQAFYGLVQVPVRSQALGVHPAYQPLVRPEVRQQAGRGAAGFAHFSVFFLGLLGPALVYGLSGTGTYPRREAAKAFNFQFIALLAFVTTVIVAGVLQAEHLGMLLPIMVLAWLGFTIVGGAKALQGEDWRNPVQRVIKIEVLKERR